MRSRVITIAKTLGFESRNLAGAVSLVRWQLSVLTHGPHLNPLPEGEEDAQRQVRLLAPILPGRWRGKGLGRNLVCGSKMHFCHLA